MLPADHSFVARIYPREEIAAMSDCYLDFVHVEPTGVSSQRLFEEAQDWSA